MFGLLQSRRPASAAAGLWLVNIALSTTTTRSFHEWLTVPTAFPKEKYARGGDSEQIINMNTEHFQAICQKAGVSKIGLLRHGQTHPKPKDGIDFDRQLTNEGRLQATKAGSSFGMESRPFYSKVLVSPSPRTMETAQLFVDASYAYSSSTPPSSKNIQLQPIQDLYDGTMQPDGSRLFRKLGYAPLQEYLNGNNSNSEDEAAEEEDIKTARTILGQYAYTVVETMVDTMTVNSNREQSSSTLWMVGHAIYLPAAALGIASLVGCCDKQNEKEALSIILTTNTKEAEGYLIDIHKKSVQYVARPK